MIRSMKRLILLSAALLVFSGCSAQVQEYVDDAKSVVDFVRGIEVPEDDEFHVVVVPGYGAPVIGNRTYEAYVAEVADFVEDEANAVDAVVFTGSYSSLENTSEAEAMKTYFDMITNTSVKEYKEECAVVSWQNVSYTKELLQQQGIVPGRVTIFGDQMRKEKLLSFASVSFNTNIDVPDTAGELFDGNFGITKVNFVGFDFGGTPTDELERQAKFAAEIAGASDPELGNQILEQRINSWTQEFDYDVAENLVRKGCTQFEGFQ